MASSSSLAGIKPASLSFVAFAVTMTRIFLSASVVETVPAYEQTTNERPRDRHPTEIFFAKRGAHQTRLCIPFPLTYSRRYRVGRHRSNRADACQSAMAAKAGFGVANGAPPLGLDLP